MLTLRILLVAILSFGMACKQERLDQLEKQNKELRAELDKQKQIVDLDTQGKCANAAKQFFHEEYPPDRSTILLVHNSHYSKVLGKCFVLIEWHYNDIPNKTGSWYNLVKLVDAYERNEYGKFSLYTDITLEPHPKSEETVYECRVNGTTCNSLAQFNQLSNQFMTN
jgi:hypothetical protein